MLGFLHWRKPLSENILSFNLDGDEYIPLCDLLKTVSLCQSGGHAKVEIASGLVLVDGEIETRKRCKIRDGQIVEYNGNQVKVTS